MVKSRRTTPSAGPAPHVAPVAQTRPTRARSTRSQSNEPSTFAPQPVPARTTRRGARQTSVESTASADSRPSRATRNTSRNTETKDLTTVEEDEDDEIDDNPNATPPPNIRDAGSTPVAPSRISMSGTTARTSASDEETEHLLLDFAPDLCNAAARILKVLTVPKGKASTIEDILQEAKKPTSTVSKQLYQHEQTFNGFLKHYGDGFLDPRKILEAIFDRHSLPPRDSSARGLIELIHSANLAYLAKWIAKAEREDPETWDFLRNLDENFPAPFLSSIHEASNIGDTELQDETFEFALAVRTQVAVTAMIQQHDQENFEPSQIVQPVFYAPSADGGVSDETLRAWNANGLGSGLTGLLPEFDTEMRQRIASIEFGSITDLQSISNGEYADMQMLEAEFSWSAFGVNTLDWIRTRKQELDTKILRLGGATVILSAVKYELGVEDSMLLSPRKFDSFGSTVAEQPTSPKGSAKKKKAPRKIGSNFFQQVENFKKQHSGVGMQVETTLADAPEPATTANVEVVPRRDSPEASHNAPRQPMVDVDDWVPNNEGEESVPNEDDNATESEAVPTQVEIEAAADKERTRRFLEKKRQNKENLKLSQRPPGGSPAKRRMFVDPQPEAERVEFDEASQAARPAQRTTSRRTTRNTNGKRPAPQEEDEEVTEDEGFQEDTRVVARKRQAPVVPQHISRPRTQHSPKHPRTEPPDSGPSRARDPSSDYEDENDENEGAPPPSTNMKQLAALARQNVALARARNNGGQRSRNPWTPREEAALERLIIEHGISWSKLKDQDDGTLDRRDQVALKDKARNMKVQFLLARVALPQNFDLVPLDKKARDRLENLGIEYDY